MRSPLGGGMSLTVRLRFLEVWALGMFLVSAAGAAAQTKPAAEKQYEQLIFSVRGPDLFRAHCAACHGPEGKGNGPVGAALKTKPADLTMLAKNNGGKFPTQRIQKGHFGRRSFLAFPWHARDARLGPDLSSGRRRPGFRQRPFAEFDQIFRNNPAEVAACQFYVFPLDASGCCSSGAEIFLTSSFSLQ